MGNKSPVKQNKTSSHFYLPNMVNSQPFDSTLRGDKEGTMNILGNLWLQLPFPIKRINRWWFTWKRWLLSVHVHCNSNLITNLCNSIIFTNYFLSYVNNEPNHNRPLDPQNDKLYHRTLKITSFTIDLTPQG